MPHPENTRAEQMFDIVTRAEGNWYGKTVVDIGCGYGDMTRMSLNAGAHKVIAIDKDLKMVSITRDKCLLYAYDGSLMTGKMDAVGLKDFLLDLSDKKNIYPDVFFFFSVWPYLGKEVHQVVDVMANSSATSYIEVQYANDGPGLWWVDSDMSMSIILGQAGFSRCQPIGTTLAKETFERTIWKCEGAK